EQKLNELKSDARLTAIARSYGDFLAKSDLFSHTADGRQSSDRLKEGGYAACASAENLAWHVKEEGYTTDALAPDVVEGWKKSPGHGKNLLTPDAVVTGVAVVKGRWRENDKEIDKYFSVQLIARPKSLSYEFTVTNSTPLVVRYVFGGENVDLAATT